MQVPVHLTFHNLEHSDAIEARVREKVAHLDQLYADRLTSCRVAIEAQHKHQHKGRRYHVRIHLAVPGGEIAVTRDPEISHAHENINTAIRDAFDAAERQLKDYIRRHRGEVKMHGLPPDKLHGRIIHLLADQSGGLVATAEGEIYFNRNSLVNTTFDQLTPGQPVEIAVQRQESEKGLQASTVRPITTMRLDPAK
jgi:ribosome-associated translation inhibitor RaiA/cold shock CspA family protein